MNNYLTYQIELTPENASKIDAINKVLLGESYSQEETAVKAPKPAASKSSKKPTKTTEPEAPASGLSLEDIRSAAKAAKAEFGEEFTMQVLKDAGVEVKATLGRSVSAIPTESYEEIAATWKSGPQQGDLDLEDDLDELDSDDLESEDEVDAEAVKVALKAYSKEHGREEAKAIMTKYKVSALSKVDSLENKQLVALMKELV